MIAMVTKERNEERFPQRKSPRIPGYDYATPNYYFITICTHRKKCLFWTDHRLNRLGSIVYDAIIQIPSHFPNVRVDSFVVMPNHIHMILVVEPGGTDASTVIGSMKSHVTRQAHRLWPELVLWQTSYHDHVIRSWNQYQKIGEYIQNNPIRWEKDCFYVE